MALGRSIVATDTDGARELLEDGVTGCVVPVGDPRAMAAALQTLLADAGRRARLGRAAAERARAYDAGVVTEQFVDAIRGVSTGRTTR